VSVLTWRAARGPAESGSMTRLLAAVSPAEPWTRSGAVFTGLDVGEIVQ
jgi:hypothetical protein